MSDESKKRDDEGARAEALFRYRLLVLLEEPKEHSLRERVAALSQRSHVDAQGQPRQLSERTLWTWLSLFRKEGLDGLRPQQRKDQGQPRVVSPALLDRAETLRRELPQRWTSTVLDILVREGSVAKDQAPHRATLDRHLLRRGASRRLLRVLGEKRTRKMSFAHFGDLWVGDYHHGPLVRTPDGGTTVAKLGAFIDHTTRFPVADGWYLDERIGSLRDTLLRALLSYGLPKVVYTDRGAVYRAEQLAYSMARLQVHLVHSRPYYSQGRGVIERWWQLADAFQAEIEARDTLCTIHELNRLWEAFRTLRYLEQVHSELGQTPNQAIKKFQTRPLEPHVARELFLVRADREVHKKDSCVSVQGHRFLCDASLRGRKVCVRYDPLDLSSVLLFVDNQRLGQAFPQPTGPLPQAPPVKAPTGPKTDYLALVRADYDQRLLAQVTPVAYADLDRCEPGFDLSRFCTLLADLTQARVRDCEAQEVNEFWARFGPLPETLVRVALEQGVRLRGTGLHVRVYLTILRTMLLQRLQNPRPTEDPNS